jgi:3-deoxy-7-phosphoheptulonate synthase
MLAKNNIHLDYKSLITPDELIHQLPASPMLIDFVHQARISAANIIQGKDHRLLVIIGPCSIHDTQAAVEYAEKLTLASARFCDDLHIIMRVYFQKPRTTLGWKHMLPITPKPKLIKQRMI